MGIKTILFDLDGTLLPMDLNVFIKGYFEKMIQWLTPYNYDPDQLYNTFWLGNRAMMLNDGSITNERAFWNAMESVYGQQAKASLPILEDFYTEEFTKLQSICGFQPLAAEIVHTLQNKGYQLILATNPLFPQQATHWRVRWAGLTPEDFELITTYENSRYCKPNLEYFRELMRIHNLKAEDCLMIGNDVSEDMVVTELGMEVFLVTDCLINKKGKDISQYRNGNFEELKNFIDHLPNLKVN